MVSCVRHPCCDKDGALSIRMASWLSSPGLTATILPQFAAIRFGLWTLFPVLPHVRAKLLAILLNLLLACRSSRRRRAWALRSWGLGYGK